MDRSARSARAYRWRAALRWAFGGLLVACWSCCCRRCSSCSWRPSSTRVGTLAALVSLTSVSARAHRAVSARSIEVLFDPPILPTILPRAAGARGADRCRRAGRARRCRPRGASDRGGACVGAFWWRLLASPLDASRARGDGGRHAVAPGARRVERAAPGAGRDRPPICRRARRQLRAAGVSRGAGRPSTTSTPAAISWAPCWRRRRAAAFEARRAGGPTARGRDRRLHRTAARDWSSAS